MFERRMVLYLAARSYHRKRLTTAAVDQAARACG
jgi:hypothetical protein